MKKLLCLWMFVAFAADAEPTKLKIGTLVPRESPWGQLLRVWAKGVKERTKGSVELEFFWNATQGDEPAQISKIKTGQLDGACVTAVGLGIVHNDVNALQMPGIFPDWAALDKAREALRPRFEKAFKEAGFELLGWGDVGLDHMITKGFEVHGPDSFKGKRPWVWREDPNMPQVFQAIGGVTTVPTSIPEVLPELSTGNVNGMAVSALAAEQLQWSSRLDHINLMVVGPNIGGLVFSKAKLDSLKPEDRAVMFETGKLAGKALTDRIRAEDVTALERLKKKMTVTESTPEELKAWGKIFAEARARMAKGTYSPEVVKQIEESVR